jgi:hypothetical protein
MNSRYADPEAALSAPFYAFALLLVATPLMDFASSIFPIQLRSPQWRFASAGLLSGFLLTPMLGIAIAMTVSAIRGHGRVQRFIAALNLLLAVALLILLIGFVLDVLQLNGMVPADGLRAFHLAAAKAVFKYVTSVLLLGLFALRGWNLASWTRGRA